MKYAKARDPNETEIVDALRARGCKVHRLEGGPGSPGVLDLLVQPPGEHADWVLLEVKDLDAKAGYYISQHKWLTEFATLREEMPMAVRNRLKESQAMFLMGHTAPMAVVTSVAEALAAVGLSTDSEEP